MMKNYKWEKMDNHGYGYKSEYHNYEDDYAEFYDELGNVNYRNLNDYLKSNGGK